MFISRFKKKPLTTNQKQKRYGPQNAVAHNNNKKKPYQAYINDTLRKKHESHSY